MDIIRVFFLSLGSLIALFLLTRLIGNRQMSQLTMFDYINGITIGSIAAEMATNLEDDFWLPLLAMVVYAVAAVCIAKATSKSIKIRRAILGKPVVLFLDGKILKGNLKKAKMDISEFLAQCRNNGYFELSELYAAMLETNGRVSFLPTAATRPATPGDLGIEANQAKLRANVILDGAVQRENLKNIGKNEAWLAKTLKDQGMTNIENVFLATCDESGNLSAYAKIETPKQSDIFE